MMRIAAIQAGLVEATPEGQQRISFISKGEASLNFCLDKDLTNESIERGEGVTIVDAGGGTLDVSTYARIDNSTHEYEEIAAAKSYFKGSVFVTRAASKYLDDFLRNTRFHEDVPLIVDRFDKKTKLAFRDSDDPQYIKFGNTRDRDPNLGIRAGQLKLNGNITAEFFEPSIQCIVSAVMEQQQHSQKTISTVFLVGGFAASDFLFAQVQQQLMSRGLAVHRPDAHLNKAVPDGAIAHSLRPVVSSRVSKYTYGIKSGIAYDPSNVEHVARSSLRFKSLSGNDRLSGSFCPILKKGIRVSETQEFRHGFFREASDKRNFSKIDKFWITRYRGNMLSVEFIDQDPENFHDIFEVRVDLSRVIDGLRPMIGQGGKRYFKVGYYIVIIFGAMEFKAQYAWNENGVEMRLVFSISDVENAEILYSRGPAEIIYDIDIQDHQQNTSSLLVLRTNHENLRIADYWT
ncbi:hypothetical protein D9756_006961 [Leucocoprinus leucothites]|uniref:Uncharacterized protein n=1 Tax=Leucocoprinus leucothites TaxID=201217 RepID=A0A8H5D5U7_9AGAR|nr:hypothetical protein D9756_006961 [Leucoagaricus leucothites]